MTAFKPKRVDNPYIVRRKGFPSGYPQPGTRQAQVLECLEAEPATCEEIARYLDTTPKIAAALAFLLIGNNLVVRIGTGRYALADPELTSLVYGSLETFS